MFDYLTGVSSLVFEIGCALADRVRFVASGGVLAVQDGSGVLTNVSGADATDPTHFATLAQLSSVADDDGLICVPVALASTNSGAVEIPTGAVVVESWIDILTVYDNSATIEIGNAGDDDAYMEAAKSCSDQARRFWNRDPADKAAAGADTQVTVTVTGAPTTGTANAYVRWEIPQT